MVVAKWYINILSNANNNINLTVCSDPQKIRSKMLCISTKR